MRVLCIEDTADGLLDLALRAKKAGHEVKYHLSAYDPVKAPVGRGLVERVHDWRTWIKWCDLCVVGGNGKWTIELDRWRAAGVPIIGGCAEVIKLELDRMAGMAGFRRKGIPVPAYRQCKNLAEAIEYVTAQDEGFAIKPCGDIGDKSLSVVGKTARETIWRLERWRREGKSFPSGLMVQERVSGVEFAVGAWVGPSGFAEGFEENAEEKRLFAGGLGPNVGEAGTVMRLVKKSKLADKVLCPFEDFLVSKGYCGNVDINTIIDEDGTPFPLEWTCRMGWPALNIELALHSGDPIEFLAGLWAGKPPKTRRLDEIAVGVVMALPPYPYTAGRAEEVVGVPIWGISPGIEDNLHLCMAMAGEGPRITDGRVEKRKVLATAGSYCLVATGTGESVVKAREGAYRVLDRLTVPASPFWRVDIGQRLRSGLDALQQHGFAAGMRYS